MRKPSTLAQIAPQPKKQRRRVSLPGTNESGGEDTEYEEFEEEDEVDLDSLGSAEASYSDEDGDGDGDSSKKASRRIPTNHRHNTRSRLAVNAGDEEGIPKETNGARDEAATTPVNTAGKGDAE